MITLISKEKAFSHFFCFVTASEKLGVVFFIFSGSLKFSGFNKKGIRLLSSSLNFFKE